MSSQNSTASPRWTGPIFGARSTRLMPITTEVSATAIQPRNRPRLGYVLEITVFDDKLRSRLIHNSNSFMYLSFRSVEKIYTTTAVLSAGSARLITADQYAS